MNDDMPERNMKKGSDSFNSGDEDLASIVDELAERLRHGEKLDWPACLRQHPRHAEALKEIAPALEVLVNFREVDRSP
jgi:hypothetical protein